MFNWLLKFRCARLLCGSFFIVFDGFFFLPLSDADADAAPVLQIMYTSMCRLYVWDSLLRCESLWKVFIEFAIFIMDDGGSGSFILCMHKTINNKTWKNLQCVIRAQIHTDTTNKKKLKMKKKQNRKIIRSWAERNHIYILYVCERIRFAILDPWPNSKLTAKHKIRNDETTDCDIACIQEQASKQWEWGLNARR